MKDCNCSWKKTWKGPCRASAYSGAGICGGGTEDNTPPDWSGQVTGLAGRGGLSAHAARQYSFGPAAEDTSPHPSFFIFTCICLFCPLLANSCCENRPPYTFLYIQANKCRLCLDIFSFCTDGILNWAIMKNRNLL